MITIALCCLLVMLVLRLGLAAIGARLMRAQDRRRYIPTAVRRHVLLRDGRRCRWCGSRKQIELDHIRPVSYGGKSIASNLQVLCRRCNRRKGGRWCLTDIVYVVYTEHSSLATVEALNECGGQAHGNHYNHQHLRGATRHD